MLAATPRNANFRGVVVSAATTAFLLYIIFQQRRSRLVDGTLGWRPDRHDDVRNRTLGVGNVCSSVSSSTSLRASKFQKIYAINLPSRTDHRDAMSLAAALTDLDIEYVPGVTDFDRHALPSGGGVELNNGSIRAWRAHMNVARNMVEQNIASALVLEDDADWDIRIKLQMQDFARAARLLVQPLPNTTDQYLDPTYPRPQADDATHKDFNIDDNEVTTKPTTSPYGDLANWDILWLGHCGCRFPRAIDGNTPIGRAVIFDDETVPEQQHIEMQFGDNQLVEQYPAHTRVVSRARVNTCTLGYALSLPGAQRLLYELGVRRMSDNTDMMFRALCDGVDDRPLFTCLTVQPELFQHHRPVGPKASFSDISDHGEGMNEKAFTRNIRWSTRGNLDKLVNGKKDFVDLFRDGEPRPELGF